MAQFNCQVLPASRLCQEYNCFFCPLKCMNAMAVCRVVLLPFLVHSWTSRQPFSIRSRCQRTCAKLEIWKTRRKCFILLSACCALLLKVAKGPANHTYTISACLGKGAKLDGPSPWPYWSPRNFWEGCVVLDVVCRGVTFPAHVILHGRCPAGDNLGDLYCCISPFFFPSYI